MYLVLVLTFTSLMKTEGALSDLLFGEFPDLKLSVSEAFDFLGLLFFVDRPDEPPLQTPQVPPPLQCPHREQFEQAVQYAEPVHLPSCPTLSLALKQEFKKNKLSVIMMNGISFLMVNYNFPKFDEAGS